MRPETKRLLRLGVLFALWSLSDASALRFVVNAALTLPDEISPPSEPRAPVDLPAGFDASGVTCHAVVHPLSTRGAFFETPRLVPKSVSTRVTIRVPDRVITLRALTIHANELEDLREQRWPIGMSVLFGGLGPDSQSVPRRCVAGRTEHFLVSANEPRAGREPAEPTS